MFETIPSSVRHNIVDHFGSPKSRQSLAQTSIQVRQDVQETDAAFYSDWLESDFGGNAPSEQSLAKAQYCDRLHTSQREKVRLLEIAAAGDVSSFAVNIQEAHIQRSLSNRYGKVPVALAGLRVVERLARPVRPYDSPPRLRDGELSDLVAATRALHTLANPPVGSRRQFSADLQAAEQGAAHQATRLGTLVSDPPSAPKRKSRSRQCTTAQHNAARRILGFTSPDPSQH